jgi:hypothetical protein
MSSFEVNSHFLKSQKNVSQDKIARYPQFFMEWLNLEKYWRQQKEQYKFLRTLGVNTLKVKNKHFVFEKLNLLSFTALFNHRMLSSTPTKFGNDC